MEPLAGGSSVWSYVANVADPGLVSPEQVGLDGLAEILVRYPREVDLAALDPEPID